MVPRLKVWLELPMHLVSRSWRSLILRRQMSRRSYYSAALADFLAGSEDSILGELTAGNEHELELTQRNAWQEQIRILKDQLLGQPPFGTHLFFEFSIPRMGKRADVILLTPKCLFVLEFKVGAESFYSADISQAVDYALDLKNFHEGSHDLAIVPILIATEAVTKSNCWSFDEDLVSNCLLSNREGIGNLISRVSSELIVSNRLTVGDWVNAPYKPTPTIIQAAEALYRNHEVSEISRSDAGAKNLTETSDAIEEIIEGARRRSEKAICFVTGVPGAGKTLAGLNISTRSLNHLDGVGAVFLSGNGPLVKVLGTALARDEKLRNDITIGEAVRRTKTFIQNIHHFRDDNLQSVEAPIEKVVVFDEAQRAWDKQHTVKFMKTKKGQMDFDASEPEFLIEVMDRHEDWCVVVALIGGGQEINSGEAGLPEWFDSLVRRFSHWKVYYSDRLTSKEYTNELPIGVLTKGLNAQANEALHLGVAIRSFRAEKLSEFVKQLIDGDSQLARLTYAAIAKNYPIVLTRDLGAGRNWLRKKARGSELFGVTASSGARRLVPEGINVRLQIEPDIWFLNGKDDVRSCQYLEEVATEFDIQGLELDWSLVAWDVDLRRCNNHWDYKKFSGTKWQNNKKESNQKYLLNSYRVLLTRARQGMVIFVPKGSSTDPTRLPEFYDPIYQYLKDCGIPELENAK